jgi:DNA-binding response OmpR family regulator
MGTDVNRKVLILDDDDAISFPIARYFRSLGCIVDVASEPEEAEALVDHRRYDLAILDLRLTALDGIEGLSVLRELRRRNQFSTVMILSGYVSPEAEDEALRLGADRVLSKPQPLPELAEQAFSLMGAERG